MQILEEVEVKLELSDLSRRVLLPRLATPDGFYAQLPRSAGVHMSGVLKPLAIAAKQLKPYEQLEEEYPLMWALGVAWEEFVASLYPGMDYQPGEVVKGGIAMTCDGLNWLDEWGEACIEEMKFTTKLERGETEGSVKSFKDEWMWLQQGKAYCYGYGPRIVRWHVLFMIPFFKGGPKYKRFTVRFTDNDISQAWNMFCANKHAAVPETH